MAPIVVIFIILGTAAAATTTTSKHCELPITSRVHYHRQWPLVFNTKGVLYDTTVSSDELIVRINDGDQVLLSCGPNYFKKFYKVESLVATCNADSESFVVEKNEIKINDLTCDLRVIEEVLSPVSGCEGAKLTASTFGYVDPTEKVSIILGEVCYDTTAGRTLWAHVKLGQNAHLQKAEKTFLTSHRHPDGRYKIELFRGLHFDEIYERIRQQLHTKFAPELKMANFVDEFFLTNAQFQAVKKLGWNYFVTYDNFQVLDKLKLDIQNYGKLHDLDLYVGSNGVHSLLGANGEKMKLYLHVSGNAAQEGRFPMPELIWIVVRQQNRAIALGVFNNPHKTDDLLSGNAVCKSECEKVTWLTETLKFAGNRKPLICCSLAELESTVEEIPKFENVNELLI